MPKPNIYISGQRFGRLVAIKSTGNDKHGNRVWKCRCDCGRFVEVIASSLSTGNSTSCGCGRRKLGYNFKRTYHIWANMKYRCLSATCKKYKDYGGRGIKVCKRWMDFEKFLEDMGEAPKGLTLDRIDNNGNYAPANCKWSTITEQVRNSRRNRMVVFHGIKAPLSVHAEREGLNYKAVCERIRNGWTLRDALTAPIRKRK